MPLLRNVRRRGLTLIPLLLGAPLIALAVAGCAESPSILRPASPEAADLANLFWGVTVIALAVFFGVEVALIYALIRFRDRPGAREPSPVHGNLPLEVAWTLIPLLAVTGIFVAMMATANVPTPAQANAMVVRVIGHQWWWEIQYPDQRITTASDLHVPAGQNIRVELTASDVIHSFWAPELFGKQDATPGHQTLIRFTAINPAEYRGFCAEFCGVQHANMGFLVIAEPRDQFDDWLKRNQTPPTLPTSGQAQRGADAFLKGPCVGCHTIDGTAAQGKMGPNLSHFGDRRTIGANTLSNTPENLATWLANPQAVKPGNRMPNLNLGRDSIQDLVAFLEGLR